MVTIARVGRFRVVIFVYDHAPAHIHVYADGEAEIDLDGFGARPVLVWAQAMKRGDVRKALRLVSERRDEFLTRWRQLHGGTE